VDSILKDMLTPEEAEQPLYAPLLEERAYYLGRRGRLRQAAADYSKLIEFEPDNTDYYFDLAPLLLADGDEPEYRKLCQSMLLRFGSATDGVAADYVAKTCCLLQPPEADLPRLDTLAAVDVSEMRRGDPAADWALLTECLVEYRLGRYANAVEWAGKTLSKSEDDSRWLSAYLVLAMAHYRLGQMADARAALAKGLELARATLPDLKSDDLERYWPNTLHSYILMREAKQLIEGQSVSAKDGGK
jgi:tetratricopeptide (TPR) repeat protein